MGKISKTDDSYVIAVRVRKRDRRRILSLADRRGISPGAVIRKALHRYEPTLCREVSRG